MLLKIFNVEKNIFYIHINYKFNLIFNRLLGQLTTKSSEEESKLITEKNNKDKNIKTATLPKHLNNGESTLISTL